MRKCAVWLIVCAAALSAQIVTKDPITTAWTLSPSTVDTSLRPKVAVHNTSGKPITAHAVNLTAGYSDGEKLNDEGSLDYFNGVGLNSGEIASGTSRETTFYISKKPETADAQLVSIGVGVAGIILEDESMAGDSGRFAMTALIRDEESAEVAGWCPDIRRLLGGPVPRTNVKNALAARGFALPIPEQAQSAHSAAEIARMEIANLFRQGFQWQSDDTAILPPHFLKILKTKCANAEQHLKRLADR